MVPAYSFDALMWLAEQRAARTTARREEVPSTTFAGGPGVRVEAGTAAVTKPAAVPVPTYDETEQQV